ncbi:MAG: PilZ domain-containing protein [Terriglobales bacterium]
MDRDILTEEWGTPQERARGTDSGTAYLRRLKTQDQNAAMTSLGSGVAAEVVAPAASDRRIGRRYQCAGSVELRAEGGVRLWGTLRDISLHGCYVEMATTFPIGRQVNLALESGGVWVRAGATIRTSYPGLGMGMCFAELAATQQLHLKQILAASAENRSILSRQ